MSERVWTDGYDDDDCLVVNLSHHNRRAFFVTFWRKNNEGYAFPLAWSGLYSRESVEASIDYYHSGRSNIAIPASAVADLLVAPGPRMIDGNVGPVVLSTAENWKRILSSMIRPIEVATARSLSNKTIPQTAWAPFAGGSEHVVHLVEACRDRP